MKELKDFSKFKMEKKQMNAVKGGVMCIVALKDGTNRIVRGVHAGITAEQAEEIVKKTYGDLWDAKDVTCG